MDFLRKRLPSWADVWLVFGVVVFIVHGWSLREFLFRVPAFLLKYDAGRILAILTYHLSFAFLESILVCVLLLIASGILPSNWLKDGFVYKGFLIILVAAIGAVALQRSFVDGVLTIDFSNVYLRYLGLGAGPAILIGLLVLAQKTPRLQKLLAFAAEQISIMLFVYLPLDMLSLLAVVIRIFR